GSRPHGPGCAIKPLKSVTIGALRSPPLSRGRTALDHPLILLSYGILLGFVRPLFTVRLFEAILSAKLDKKTHCGDHRRRLDLSDRLSSPRSPARTGSAEEEEGRPIESRERRSGHR